MSWNENNKQVKIKKFICKCIALFIITWISCILIILKYLSFFFVILMTSASRSVQNKYNTVYLGFYAALAKYIS